MLSGLLQVLLTDISEVEDASIEKFTRWLGETEHLRLRGFVRAERRKQFVIGRALLRMALARILKVFPAEVVLIERPGQAPALQNPSMTSLGFSISHSGRWVACAVSSDGQIGLDIEVCDESRDILQIADQVFGNRATDFLRECSENDRYLQFYRMWCEYEAKFKLGSIKRPDFYMTEIASLPKLLLVVASAKPLFPLPTWTFVKFRGEVAVFQKNSDFTLKCAPIQL